MDECKPLLPGNPNAVFTVRKNSEEEFDSYIVVSFTNATLVLSIGDTVEEVSDSGFLGRGLHSFTSQLNLSAFHGIGGARRSGVARVNGVLMGF